VPLVVVPPSMTLVLSADPACTVPGGNKLTFPPVMPSPATSGQPSAGTSAASPDMTGSTFRPITTAPTDTSPPGFLPNPELQPGTPISITTATGLVLQIDSKTGLLVFALPSAPAAPGARTFTLINPDNLSKPVQPGDPVVLLSAATDKYCAFSQAVPQSLLSLPDEDQRRRALLTHQSLPQSCGIKCMACYLDSIKQASKLTYRWVPLCHPVEGSCAWANHAHWSCTGGAGMYMQAIRHYPSLSLYCTHTHSPCSSNGLSLDGTPLAPLKGSGVLVPSSDPQCILPDGSRLLFTPTPLTGKLENNSSRQKLLTAAGDNP
jgi:hypothetical protein